MVLKRNETKRNETNTGSYVRGLGLFYHGNVSHIRIEPVDDKQVILHGLGSGWCSDEKLFRVLASDDKAGKFGMFTNE